MENKKNLRDWTLGEVAESCRKRVPADSLDVKSACVGCQFNGTICDVLDNCIIVNSPDGWVFPPDGRIREPVALERSRLATVLGVEENKKKWRYGCAGLYRVHNGVREYWDENNGWLYCDCEEDLVKIIAHPESIIRVPRLTEPEIAIMRAVGAKYVSSLDHEVVALWGDKPTFDADIKDGWDYTFSFRAEHLIAGVSAALFPSVKPGDCIRLEEVEDGTEVD